MSSVSFSLKPIVADVEMISRSLLCNPKLSAASLGVFCFTLGVFGGRDFTIDDLVAAWNEAGRSRENSLGRDRMRRLVNEWRLAGFVYDTVETDDEGRVAAKKFAIFPQVDAAPVPRAKAAAKPTSEARKSKLARFPAAEVFQNYFNVDLDLDAIQYIEKEAGPHLQVWGQVCADHYNSLTQQQKDSITYKTRAVKFVLHDLRSHLEKQALRATKTPFGAAADAEPPDRPKKKTFADYVSGYEYGSAEYKKFRKGWIKRADEAGNAAAIEQVTEYEGIRSTLDKLQKRKGGVQK